MGVSFSAEAGYGIRLNIDPKTIGDKKFDELRKYIWKHASKSAHKYYENVETMLNEDNLDYDSVSEAFKHLRFVWCGNPYFQNSKVNQYFAVADTTYAKIDDDAGYVDLHTKSRVSPEAIKELELLRPLAVDEEQPRWYMMFNIG
jgi:hypothetical protein